MFKLSRRRKQARKAANRKLNVQQLEKRELMAADISLTGGILQVDGTADRDNIEIVQEGSQVVASVNSRAGAVQKSYNASSVSQIVVRAGNGDDVITNNTAVRSSLYGGDGNDLIIGGSRSDYISAGGGHDAVYGGAGSDRIYGSDGDDKLYGESGSDTIFAGNGNDQLIGGSGNDQLWGDSGNDALWGGSGTDRLDGGSGDDYLAGGSSNDRLYGGSGNDVLDGDTGNDRLNGGSGNDAIYGGQGHDQIFGDSGDDSLFGGSGDDRLYGGSGRDTVYGGSGRDYLSGGYGSDRLYGGTGYDRYANRWENMRSSANGSAAPDVDEPTGRNSSDLSSTQLDRIVDAAIQKWEEAGLDDDLVAELAKAEFRVADLPAGKLGTFTRAADGDVTIWIDNNGGGAGWFVDATPQTNQEFTARGDSLQANRGSAAESKIDLLTVVSHELGHAAGLQDDDQSFLMASVLDTGIRHLPDTSSVSQATTNVVIADLRNGWYSQGTFPALFGANFALGRTGLQDVQGLHNFGLNYPGFAPSTIYNPFAQNYYGGEILRLLTGGGFRGNTNNQTIQQGAHFGSSQYLFGGLGLGI